MSLIGPIFFVGRLVPLPLLAALSSVCFFFSLLPCLFVNHVDALLTPVPSRVAPTITVSPSRDARPLVWYDDALKLTLPRDHMLYPNPFSFLTRINPSCGFSFSMLIKITVTPSGICITHSPSASPPHPHSSATMMTLPSSPIHPRLRIYDAIVTGVSFVKRLRIYAIYDSLRSAVLPVRNTRSNNLRLCACVIPTITLDGTEYVVITRRKARVGKSATFSSMWVFPGGHVDVLPANVAERPSLAAVRELKEETGLQVIYATPFRTVHPFACQCPRHEPLP